MKIKLSNNELADALQGYLCRVGMQDFKITNIDFDIEAPSMKSMGATLTVEQSNTD